MSPSVQESLDRLAVLMHTSRYHWPCAQRHVPGACPATPSDLRRRIDRTLDYIDELQRHAPLSADTGLILTAIYQSLTTPAQPSRNADQGGSGA